MSLDFQILYFLQMLRSELLDNIMKNITYLGEAGWLWIVLSIVLVCLKKTRWWGIHMMISLLIMHVTGNMILKNLIARERPCWIDETIMLVVANPSSYSFPSGHTYSGFASAVSIFMHDKKWGTAALVLASLIAFSRMYLFVHFPSDILAGIILGILTAFLADILVKKIQNNKKQVA